MEYPFSVFMGFQKAARNEVNGNLRALQNVIRVAASDDNKRNAQLWRELKGKD